MCMAQPSKPRVPGGRPGSPEGPELGWLSRCPGAAHIVGSADGLRTVRTEEPYARRSSWSPDGSSIKPAIGHWLGRPCATRQDSRDGQEAAAQLCWQLVWHSRGEPVLVFPPDPLRRCHASCASSVALYAFWMDVGKH